MNAALPFRTSRGVLGITIAVLGLLVLAGASAQAARLKVLYDFCPQGNCSRSFSNAGLLADSSGNLYGTREIDGADGPGRAYELSFDGKKWKYRVLHEFCSAQSCADGARPEAGLIIDSAGNLYGTASEGGNTGKGVFFEIKSDGDYRVLYNFCPDGNTCADGAAPESTLTYNGAQTGQPYDGASPLYGTGIASDNGIVFELTQSGGNWSSATIHSFADDGQDCPSGSVTLDAAGNLFGATEYCGDDNAGKAFALGQGQDGWSEISHYSFFDDKDGDNPYGPLIEDSRGRLYVATRGGGVRGEGVIVRLAPVVDTYVPKVLHQFRGGNGAWPVGGLVSDAAGNFFGTASGGGKGSGGTVFELSGTSFRTLYQFCFRDTNCAHGANPIGSVVLDSAGHLYGTTTLGGANGAGTIFEIATP